MLNEALRRRTSEEWLRDFDAIGLPCGPLNDIPQAALHPQIKARDMLEEGAPPPGFSRKAATSPLRLSRTPAAIQGPPPALGEHTDEVLTSLVGLSAREIAELRAAGAGFRALPSPAEALRRRQQ